MGIGLDALWPRACGGCGRRGAARLCPACAPRWLTRVPLGLAGVDGVLILGPYDGPLGAAVARAKSQADLGLLRAVGDALAAAAAPTLRPVAEVAPALLPAPSRPATIVRRGFAGGAVLARAVGRSTGLPVLDVLRRRRGRSQAGLGAAARAANLAGAVEAIRPVPADVVLVDDVLTTGATASACAAAAREAGARRVFVLVVAATVRPAVSALPDALPAMPSMPSIRGQGRH